MRTLLLSLALLTPTFAFSAEPEIKGTLSELTDYLSTLPKVVTITGESEIRLQADRATVTLRIVTEDRSLEMALRANQVLRSRMNLQLTQAGIPEEAITAGKFASTPRTGAFSDKARSYKVENTMKIQIKDEKQFNTVAKLVDNNPEVFYSGVELERTDKDATRKKAIGDATKDAVARKAMFEETLGVKLVPKRFTENFHAAKEMRQVEMSKESDSRSIGYSSGDTVTHAFGEMVFKASVTVEYALLADSAASDLTHTPAPGQNRVIETRTLRVPPIPTADSPALTPRTIPERTNRPLPSGAPTPPQSPVYDPAKPQ